ncbi:chromosome partitioning protein, ParB family [Brevinema andersonii]|uniref:Chromosome partitioning protein, ParB family n=1 Tax=Brevinema andersonii TaxID=34097 RepID=A0A1I1D5Z7_BREAD|nr:ParB/RepB/Spo0J family partition protein [Brevinema andersonii]SFB70207.1 chromosome partitioning protein, ParB family [Brevinema andersonii]
MAYERKTLGKGLSALVDEQINDIVSNDILQSKVNLVQTEKILPNRYQPRKEFNDASLEDLADSIKEYGIIQPLIVSDLGNGQYELVAGERRLRAAKIANLLEVPIIVKEFNDHDRLVLALIENIQREDLNCIEIAESYQEIMDKLQITQEQVAQLVGKSRTSITNTLRLLKLPMKIRKMILRNNLSEGHGRAILGLDDINNMILIAEQIDRDDLSVRESEELVRIYNKKNRKDTVVEKTDQKIEILENKLISDLGLNVKVSGSIEKGIIKIFYHTKEDLENFIKRIM